MVKVEQVGKRLVVVPSPLCNSESQQAQEGLKARRMKGCSHSLACFLTGKVRRGTI